MDLSIKYDDTPIRTRIDRLAKTTKDLGGKRLLFGTPVTYAVNPQFGIGQPQRRFLGVSEDDVKEISAILDDAIADPPENGVVVLQEIGEYLLLEHNRRFKEKIDPDGNKWRPLSPWWLAEKRRMGRALGILENTLRLKKSFTYQIVSGRGS